MAGSPMTSCLHGRSDESGSGVSGGGGKSARPSTDADDDTAQHLREVAYEAFVRAAASAAGCPAGVKDERYAVTLRVDPQSGLLDFSAVSLDRIRLWPHVVVDVATGVLLWLEQPGRQEQHRALLARLAAALRTTTNSAAQSDVAEGTVQAAVSVLLDSTASRGSHRAAAARLGLSNRQPLYVVASAGARDVTGATAPEAMMRTRVGVVRASIRMSPPELLQAGPTQRLGVGTSGDVDHLPSSWQQALIALRLTSPWTPVRHWASLGAMAVLAGAVDYSTTSHADEQNIERAAAEPWGLETMEAIIRTSGIRSGAEALGLHHSTLQVRRDRLSKLMGYAIDTPEGRIRLAAGLVLHYMRKNVFDGP
jgi:hypothetical protein